MSDILIKVDLDNEEYQKSLKETEKLSEDGSKKIGKSLDKNISDTLNKSVSKSVENTNSHIKKLNETLKNTVSAAIAIAPALIFIEKRFGIFTKLFDKMGLDLSKIVSKVFDVVDAIKEFINGEKAISSVKLAIGLLLQELGIVNSGFLKFIDISGSAAKGLQALLSSTSVFAAIGFAMAPVAANLKSLTDLAKGLGSVIFKDGGLFGFTSALAATSVGLLATSELLLQVDNSFAKFAGGATKVTAVLLGGLAAALGFAIIKLTDLGFLLGTQLVGFFDKSAKGFNDTEQSLAVFGATVDSVNRSVKSGIGTVAVWNGIVKKIAKSFNFTEKAIRKSAQEILLVGPKLGLVESQMRKLLKVSAEYAKINGKDVFQSTVNFVNALSGNAQAVQAYGVKLSQASIQQYAYAKGISRSVASMGDGEKVQLRYNKLMKQYKEVAGIGAIAAGALADQQKRLEINQKRLTASLGEGARIIEQNNILAWVMNLAIENVSQSVLKVTGFLGAFGARVLQIGSLILGITFKAYALIKAIKILQLVLASEIGMKAFASNIPLINKSMNDLLSTMSKQKVEVKSLSSLMSAFSTTMKVSVGGAIGFFTRSANGSIPAMTAMRAGLAKTMIAMKGMLVVSAPFLIVAAKIAIVVAIVAGVIYTLVKAFQFIEDKTKAFTIVWQLLVDAWNESANVFEPVLNFFKELGAAIVTLVVKGFGLLIRSIAGVFRVFLTLIELDPFGVFSEKTTMGIKKVGESLGNLSEKIAGVDNDIRKLSDNSGRNLAAIPEKSMVNLEELMKKLKALREEYANYGKSELQILQETEAGKLAILQLSFDNQKIQLEEFTMLKRQVEDDYRNQKQLAEDEAALKSNVTFSNMAKAFKVTAQRMKKTSGDLAKTIMNVAVNGFGRGFTEMGRAMANGTNALDAFADSMKSMLADLAGALGDYYIAQGIAMSANPLTPGAGSGMIAGGLGLKVLAGLLGGGGGGGGSSSSSGGGGVASSSNIGNEGSSDLTSVQAEKAEPDTNIVVNIAGDILDSQESGTRFVNTINDVLGKNGVSFRDLRTV